MKRSELIKPLIFISGICIAFILWRFTPLGQYATLDNVRSISRFAESLGWVAAPAYFLLYTFGAVLMIPGSVLTSLGGLSFGVFWGTVLVSLGSTSGAALAFLTARYLARPTVEKIVLRRPMFKKLDDGVSHLGWRMVAVTRLLPFFPYMFVNYAFGLTRVGFWTYVFWTFLCMLPANFAICLAAGSLVSGGDDWKKIYIYLLTAGVAFSILAFIPKIVRKRLPASIIEPTVAERKGGE